MRRLRLPTRPTLAWLAACLLSASWGCAPCGTPYDYCPPTFTGCSDTPCDARYRAGSILYGGGAYGDMIYEGEFDEGGHEGEYQEDAEGAYYDDMSSYDVDEYDESGRPAELHLTAEEAYGYETPEYARRPPASFVR